jgi:hypothetical protein
MTSLSSAFQNSWTFKTETHTNTFTQTSRLISIATLLAATVAPSVYAAPTDQAYRIYNRITGTPPTAQMLQNLTMLVENGQADNAASLAMQDPSFCSVTLKNFAAKYTTFDASPLTPMNDASALIIGLIRDSADFRQVLTADLTYIGADGVVTAPYSQTDNEHYVQLEQSLVDLCDPDLFVATAQSALPDTVLTPGDTAGYMTTRGAAEQFYEAGTNRAMYRAVSMNFMCKDLEALSDTSIAPDRIRQDVPRSPGGSSELFLNNCIGCHAGMDALAGAFAYYQWNEDEMRLEFTPGEVQPKFLINPSIFPSGYVTSDDSWINKWREGSNRTIGWSESLPGAGNGPKSFGEEIGNSQQFANCQVERVFEEVCFRKPTSLADKMAAASIAQDFAATNYNMKTVFAKTAVHCMGE